jgi:hypothetical protein
MLPADRTAELQTWANNLVADAALRAAVARRTVDGAVGHIRDFYFDDLTWVVRYLVVDTGNWLAGRQVLLTPHALGPVDLDHKSLGVTLNRHQIERSPSIEQHQPVSRQFEIDYYRYYGWPAYWDGGALWGLGGYPVVLPPSREELDARHHHHRADKHLNSTQAVNGYAIQTRDGALGQVAGFMVDDRSWAIRELVVETGRWYAHKEILVPTGKVARISYEESKVFVDLSKSDIEHTAKSTVVHSADERDAAPHFPTD